MTAAVLPNPGLAIAELGNPAPRRSRRKNTKGGAMATKTKSRRRTKKRAASKKPRYGTKAFYSMIGKKGARKAKRKSRKKTAARKPGLRKVRRRFYPSFTYKRGPKRGRHYRPIALHKYSKSAKRHGVKKRRHPSVKWSGRKGTRLYTYKTTGGGRNKFGYFTNPKRRSYRRTRRNPMSIAKVGRQYVGGLTGAPAAIMKTFQGKNALRNTAYMAVGGAAAYIGSGYLGAWVVNPLLDRIGITNQTAKRVIGAAMPYTTAFVVTRFVKDRQLKTALMVGGALGSIVELIAPGKIGQLVARIPGASQLAMQEAAASPAGTSGLHGPVAGLGGYVSAPSYQGVAGYVSAPSYQGVAGYVAAPAYQGAGDGMNGYVEAPGYQGAGDGMGNVEMLAGFSDDNQPVGNSSFLEQSFLTA